MTLVLVLRSNHGQVLSDPVRFWDERRRTSGRFVYKRKRRKDIADDIEKAWDEQLAEPIAFSEKEVRALRDVVQEPTPPGAVKSLVEALRRDTAPPEDLDALWAQVLEALEGVKEAQELKRFLQQRTDEEDLLLMLLL